MNFEKFTDRARGFIQNAEQAAKNRHHQRITPEHLLKTLLDDEEGLAASLIAAAGGSHKRALEFTDSALRKLPEVQGT